MSTRTYAILALLATTAIGARAAFLVEAHESGVASDHFQGIALASIPSKAPGLSVWGTATNSVYGKSDTDYDWTYHYTPLVDVDNFLPDAGFDLRNNHRSSGLRGGVPGLYNVYITWPLSDNPDPTGCKITVTSDGPEVVLDPVDMRTGRSGSPGGNDGWLRIGNRIHLTTGRTYTVNQVANNPTGWPSQRSHGVLWELAEPDVPVADFVESDGVTSVEEGGVTDAYTIVLQEQPSTTVIVTAEVFEPNQIAINGVQKIELTFTPDDWSVPQVIDVVAQQDSNVEPEKAIWVLHMIRVADANFADPAWDNAFGGIVNVYVRDYSVPHVMIKETNDATVVSEEAGFDSYTVELLYPPTYAVTVTIATDGQTLVDKAQLVFMPADYNVAQTVTVTAVDDDVLEREHMSLITHTVSSLDGAYNDLVVRDVDVDVDDNECGAWGYMVLDLNEDCVVNIVDLARFASSWLDCTQPYAVNCLDLR